MLHQDQSCEDVRKSFSEEALGKKTCLFLSALVKSFLAHRDEYLLLPGLG